MMCFWFSCAELAPLGSGFWIQIVNHKSKIPFYSSPIPMRPSPTSSNLPFSHFIILEGYLRSKA